MKNIYNNKILKKTNRKDLVILLCILLLVFFSNLIIISSFAYFSQNQTATGTIQLGELDFSIDEKEKTEIKVLPDIAIDKVVYVGNYRDSNPNDHKKLVSLFLRFKCLALIDDKVDEELSKLIKLSSDDEFYYDNDYYYYCGTLYAGETVDLCNKLYFDKTIDNEYQQQQIQLQFLVDAVQSQNQAYKEIWPDYPPEWEKQIAQ